MKKRVIFVLFILFCMGKIMAQNISGVVYDSKNEPLPGVAVVVKGTTKGTTTDLDGKFSITNVTDASKKVLVISYVGFETIEQPIGNEQNFKFSLQETSKTMNEVVVVGYGVKKKSLVTGATSSISTADMSSSIMRAEQAMQGKAPGVVATPASGSPGSAMKVRIRGTGSNGTSDPLYIVDGMKTTDISYIAPTDIESMEILKDAASSAIFGAEGANGVVIIKTKAGKSGDGKIEFNTQFGFQSLPKFPKMMNAQEYSSYMKEGGASDISNASTLPNPSTLSTGTDWLKQIAETAPMQTYNISFSGGSDKGTYFLSAAYDNQNGVVGGSKANYERIATRLNISQKLKPWIEVGANIGYTNSKKSSISEDDGFNGVINSALMFDPTVNPTYSPSSLTSYMQSKLAGGKTLLTDDNGNYYGLSSFLGGEIINPLIRLAREKGITTTDRLLSTDYINLKPIKGLTVTSRLGIDLSLQNYHSWTPSYYANDQMLCTSAAVTDNDQKFFTWLWENFATYNFKVQDHNFTIMAGTSAEKYTYTNLNTNASAMIEENDQFSYPDYVTSRKNDVIGGRKEVKTKNSYFGRLSYDYKNKYMAEFTYRADGSSLFGSNNRFGYFPSISAGWVVSEESFWKKDFIDFLKIRGSWGRNGSLSNLGVDQYRAIITSTGIFYPDASGTLIPGSEVAVLPNPNLKWETSEQTDLGVDLRALNSHLYMNIDLYRKVTKDLLTTATPALSSGNYAPYWNAGEVTNDGVEILVGYQNKKNAFSYDVNVNVSFEKNKVTGMNSAVTRIDGASLPTLGTLTYMELNQPIYYFRGYKTEGIFQNQAQIDAWKTKNKITDASYKPVPGDPIVKNIVDDGTIDVKDMTNIGNPHPSAILGTNISLGYNLGKNNGTLDFNLFAQGAFGQKDFIGFIRTDRPAANRLEYFYTDRWTSGSTNATMPRATYSSDFLLRSDLMVKDGSYMKIRQIQLGYTLPASLTQKALIQKARIFVSLNDYFTFSKYPGLDPEIGSQNNNAQGIDYGFYPVSKKILFGISVTL